MPTIVAPSPIGTITCTYLGGPVNDPQMIVEIEREPGRNGYIGVLTGKGESDARKTAKLISYDAVNGNYTNTLAAVDTWIRNIKKCAGKVVTIVDDFGTLASPNVSETILITKVSNEPRRSRFLNSSGVAGVGSGIKAEIEFECVQRE